MNDDLKWIEFSQKEGGLGNHIKRTAYVDGSFNQEEKKYGYSVILFDQYGNRYEYAFCGRDPRLLVYRNVTGEILAAKLAVTIACNTLGMRTLTLVHDYDGISKWPLKEWKPKNSFTQEYYDFMEHMMLHREVKIYFKQVKSHSGDLWNERADKLAREAVDIL